MTCLKPLLGWRYPYDPAEFNTDTGKYKLHFTSPAPSGSVPVSVPCGQCLSCRIDYSRDWAARCVHESQLHAVNSYITLTYDDIHLPDNYGLEKDALQKFMKRYRKMFGNGIRFFGCGEYGEETSRPHYHLIIFGHDLPDKVFLTRNYRGEPYYTSALLRQLWPYGNNIVAGCSYQSCAYVARYILKKQRGRQSDAYYGNRLPEFCRMSLKPGIGFDWIVQNYESVYARDNIIINGKPRKPPRYYDKFMELYYPEIFDIIRTKRLESAAPDAPVNFCRLSDRHECLTLKVAKLKRM